MRAKRLIIKLLSSLVMLFALFASANAASAATPEPIDPSKIFTIGGTMSDCGKGIAGVNFHIIGPGLDAISTTDKAGRWSAVAPQTTRYEVDRFTVEIDTTTLPKGRKLFIDNTKRTIVFNHVNSASATFRLAEIKCEGTTGGNGTNAENPALNALFNGINLGLMLAMAAIGLSLIYGTTGLSNFAHGEMVTVGALTLWTFNKVLLWDLIPSALLAIAIVTLFVLTQGATWEVLGVKIPAVNIMCSGISILVLIAFTLFLTKTRIGKATRAVSDNPSLAASTGIDVEKIIRVVWVVAALLTGISGVFIGLYMQAAWDTGFSIILLVFAAVTLGGLGTSSGAAIGAMIIGLIVIIIMKGPGYVSDPYYLPKEDKALENPPQR
jgi:branched-chain amino acid transport system permease protein